MKLYGHNHMDVYSWTYSRTTYLGVKARPHGGKITCLASVRIVERHRADKQ